jgi:hypothetical protein
VLVGSNVSPVLFFLCLARLVGVNFFWADYASYLLRRGPEEKQPFLSQFLAFPTSTFTEMMFALAVFDLPYIAAKHVTNGARAGVFTFKASTPVVMFHKEIRDTEVVPSSMAINQNYFDPDDATEEKGDERTDKYIAREFLPNKIYGMSYLLITLCHRPPLF